MEAAAGVGRVAVRCSVGYVMCYALFCAPPHALAHEHEHTVSDERARCAAHVSE